MASLSKVSPDDQYRFGPDSLPLSGVLHGEIFEITLNQSKAPPGTRRRFKVYVPAQYKADCPVCVYVQLDDLDYANLTALDNLID